MSEKKVYIKTKDYSISKESFILEYEPSLDMLITTPQPKDISKYYKEESYISHKDESKQFLDKIYFIVKKYTLNKKIKFISQYQNESKTLLDIGTGTGDFLNEAKRKNWTTTGIEINPIARQKAQSKDLEIFKSIEHLGDKKYNLITLWHVLEHLPNLEEQIEKLDNLLEVGGTLIIAVPNYKSYDAKYYKHHWAAFDVPRHLWHFSKNSIKILFKKKGLNIKKITPMYFDSYYVSILSEKYKNGKTNYFNAMYRGWQSNLEARRTGQYSSLIYTLQRG
ncbi:class I SAM-dependent methyltransferase [Maribacter confluentis]